MKNLDLILGFALVYPLAFGSVCCFFGARKALKRLVAERRMRVSPVWVERRKWGRP